jgi:hypothetical protein
MRGNISARQVSVLDIIIQEKEKWEILTVLMKDLHGGSVVARLTDVLQSRVRIRRLPSPQLTANLLVGCHLGWHLAAG